MVREKELERVYISQFRGVQTESRAGSLHDSTSHQCQVSVPPSSLPSSTLLPPPSLLPDSVCPLSPGRATCVRSTHTISFSHWGLKR